MKRMLQPEQWRRRSFAGALEADDRFLLALARQDEEIAGLGAVEMLQQAASLRGVFGRVDARPRPAWARSSRPAQAVDPSVTWRFGSSVIPRS